jgi:hypothetical protein
MRRTRIPRWHRLAMAEQAAMETNYAETWNIAIVSAPSFSGEFAYVDMLEADGVWANVVDAGAPAAIVLGGQVGVRAVGRNTSSVPALCSINTYTQKPDGTQVNGTAIGGTIAAGGTISSNEQKVVSDQVGTYKALVVLVVG